MSIFVRIRIQQEAAPDAAEADESRNGRNSVDETDGINDMETFQHELALKPGETFRI